MEYGHPSGACVFGAYLIGILLWRGVEKRLFRWVDENIEGDVSRSMLRALVDIGNIAGFIVLMQVSGAIFQAMGQTPRLLDAASELAVAWIIIRFLTSIMPQSCSGARSLYCSLDRSGPACLRPADTDHGIPEQFELFHRQCLVYGTRRHQGSCTGRDMSSAGIVGCTVCHPAH